uniref:Uncharacterized protein n=1 Tax=Glossina pallidipes TaxID=7398 RepID=A0A1B0AFG7_GLOPL
MALLLYYPLYSIIYYCQAATISVRSSLFDVCIIVFKLMIRKERDIKFQVITLSSGYYISLLILADIMALRILYLNIKTDLNAKVMLALTKAMLFPIITVMIMTSIQ